MTKDYRGKDNRPKNRSLERCQRVITAAIFFYNELKKVGSNQPPPVMIRVNSAAVSEFHFVRLIVGVQVSSLVHASTYHYGFNFAFLHKSLRGYVFSYYFENLAIFLYHGQFWLFFPLRPGLPLNPSKNLFVKNKLFYVQSTSLFWSYPRLFIFPSNLETHCIIFPERLLIAKRTGVYREQSNLIWQAVRGESII